MTTGVPTSTAPRRRSPARTFVPLAIAAWLILEIWLLTLVAGAAGGLTVAALLAGGMVLGAVVIKRAGRRAFKNLADTFQQAQQGVQPTAQRPGQGNGLTMLAGLMLMMPGLISDAAGLVLLLPPVRAWIGRRAARSLERKMASAPAGSFGGAFQQARIHQPDGKIVQGEVVREDRPAPDPRGPGHQGPDTSYRPPLTP
ncbi:FxsA family membrane protein [Streptomyces sp. NPDC058701]|uniref:FxsA family membrane protein n=1 Tax=Streptomyces sp. NPDC058701 TaxID=3346608 RepID=UPI00365C46F4